MKNKTHSKEMTRIERELETIRQHATPEDYEKFRLGEYSIEVAMSEIEKKLLGHISRFCMNERGYCFASNPHFAKVLGKSIRSVQRHLDKLEAQSFIRRDWAYYRGKFRRIIVMDEKGKNRIASWNGQRKNSEQKTGKPSSAVTGHGTNSVTDGVTPIVTAHVTQNNSEYNECCASSSEGAAGAPPSSSGLPRSSCLANAPQEEHRQARLRESASPAANAGTLHPPAGNLLLDTGVSQSEETTTDTEVPSEHVDELLTLLKHYMKKYRSNSNFSPRVLSRWKKDMATLLGEFGFSEIYRIIAWIYLVHTEKPNGFTFDYWRNSLHPVPGAIQYLRNKMDTIYQQMIEESEYSRDTSLIDTEFFPKAERKAAEKFEKVAYKLGIYFLGKANEFFPVGLAALRAKGALTTYLDQVKLPLAHRVRQYDALTVKKVIFLLFGLSSEAVGDGIDLAFVRLKNGEKEGIAYSRIPEKDFMEFVKGDLFDEAVRQLTSEDHPANRLHEDWLPFDSENPASSADDEKAYLKALEQLDASSGDDQADFGNGSDNVDL